MSRTTTERSYALRNRYLKASAILGLLTLAMMGCNYSTQPPKSPKPPVGCCQSVSHSGQIFGCDMLTQAECESDQGYWVKASTCRNDGHCDPPPPQKFP